MYKPFSAILDLYQVLYSSVLRALYSFSIYQVLYSSAYTGTVQFQAAVLFSVYLIEEGLSSDKLRILIDRQISRCTRPDIAYSVSYLSQFSNVANKEHWTALLRVLRYLKKTIDRPLVLKVNSTTTKDLVINVEADSDWAGDRTDRKSQTGVLVTLNGGVLNYFSSKQATVSLSSTEAEYIAAAEACKEGLYFRNLINELKPVQLPIHLHVDNLGAGFIAQNSVNNNRTKHIDIKWHMIRDWIAKKVFELFYIKSCDNRADLLTKALAGPANSALTDRVLSAKPLDSGSQD